MDNVEEIKDTRKSKREKEQEVISKLTNGRDESLKILVTSFIRKSDSTEKKQNITGN